MLSMLGKNFTRPLFEILKRQFAWNVKYKQHQLSSADYFPACLAVILPLPLSGHFQQTTNWWYFSYFSQKTGFDISCKLSPQETVCMKCQILFSGKNNKNISKCRLLKISPRVLSVKALSKIAANNILNLLLLFFRENKIWHFMWIIFLVDDLHELAELRFYGPVNPSRSCRASQFT